MDFLYYENGYPQKISRRMAYHLFVTKVDEEQKKAGTTFQTWLYDVIKAGLLITG